jgi:oligoribonuclease
MTGLDDAKDVILEVAAVVTDKDFNVLEEFHRVVFQPPEALSGMDDWCRKTHGASGLIEKVSTGAPPAEVEKELIALADRHYPKKDDRIVLCGNSVGNDRRFIDRYWPAFAKRLHYRLIDVSSFKEIFREKYGVKFDKKNAHRAVDDIHESIAEIKAYLSFVQIPERRPS